MIQTTRLDTAGTINFSAMDGSVQKKLTPEKNRLEYTTDIIPRFSPDGGANYRTVEWNSATVYYVDAAIGASSAASIGRTVFSSIANAMTAITDSSYTKPYVLKVRSSGGTELAGASLTKPYVWLQGDGATRVGEVVVLADGVRVSGLITYSIRVGSTSLSPADLDNVWITNNIVTNSATGGKCQINVSVGGGSRYHGIVVSNNRLGGSNDPGSSVPNRCSLVTNAGDSGTSTVVQLVGNYVENPTCDVSNAPLKVGGATTADTSRSVVVSSGNTFICSIPAGTPVTGNVYNCVTLDGNMGSLYSVSDTCVLSRPDSGPSVHSYHLASSAASYSSSIMRRAEFINPVFSVSLSGSHLSGDNITYLYLQSPYLTLALSNPRYTELALGSGWTSSDKHFVTISGSGSTPPSGSNTSLRWDNVVTAPAGDIVFIYGASASSINAAPQARVVPDGFAAGLILEGANLPSTCTQYETRYDTGGSTKEFCICDPANTWNCAGLGARQD